MGWSVEACWDGGGKGLGSIVKGELEGVFIWLNNWGRLLCRSKLVGRGRCGGDFHSFPFVLALASLWGLARSSVKNFQK